MKFDASLLVHNLEQMPTLAHFAVQDSVDVPLDARRVYEESFLFKEA